MKWFRLSALGTAAVLAAVACGSDGKGDGNASNTGGTNGADGGSTGGDGDNNSGDGSGGGESTGKGFDLVSHYPEADSTVASALSPIELKFSSPVDASGAAAALRVRVGGKELSFNATVDGDTVRLQLDELPSMPAQVSVSVTADLVGTNGTSFSGDSFSFTYPLWLRGPELPSPTDSQTGIAALPGGQSLVVNTDGEKLTAQLRTRDGWTAIDVPDANGELSIVGAVATETGALVAWIEREAGQDSLHVGQFGGTRIERLGGAIATAPRLSADILVGEQGRPTTVVLDSMGQLQAHAYASGAWSPRGNTASIPAADEISAAASGSRLVVGHSGPNSVIQVLELNSDSWSPLGSGVARELDAGAPKIDVAATANSVYLAYLDGDTVSAHALVAEFNSGGWSRAGSALDLEMNNDVRDISISLNSEGVPSVAWVEQLAGQWAVLAARRQAPEWTILGEPLFTGIPSTANSLETASTAEGWLQTALSDDAEVHFAQFNGSPTLPAGIKDRGDRGTCEFPSDSDVSFPTTLAATGCYENLTTQDMVSAAIPYNINSILWSDRAYKRRYILLPDGETMQYSAESEFIVPVGTVVIKEFYLESNLGQPASRVPVETRFLVKRCNEGATCETTPWQGYSFQWNRAGNDGILLAGTAPSEAMWPVSTPEGAIQHTHLYPSRAQCVECHNGAGRLLGVSGAQLNRPQNYDGVIDNQIRALATAGLFGATAPDGQAEALERLPSPPDVGRSPEERSLAYFQSNCAHCHRPGGTQATIDFRFYGPGPVSGGNICNQISPGNHTTSNIYIRDNLRDWVSDTPQQMPPIATHLRDEQQLPVTEAWINSTTSCP